VLLFSFFARFTASGIASTGVIVCYLFRLIIRVLEQRQFYSCLMCFSVNDGLAGCAWNGIGGMMRMHCRNKAYDDTPQFDFQLSFEGGFCWPISVSYPIMSYTSLISVILDTTSAFPYNIQTIKASDRF